MVEFPEVRRLLVVIALVLLMELLATGSVLGRFNNFPSYLVQVALL
jgi:hypothetical protein